MFKHIGGVSRQPGRPLRRPVTGLRRLAVLAAWAWCLTLSTQAGAVQVRVLFGSDPRCQMQVLWHTSECAPGAGLDLLGPEGTWNSHAAAVRGPNAFGWDCRVQLQGLRCGTQYRYRLTSPGQPPVEGEFRTAPATATDFTFAVVGDVQGKGASTRWREASAWLAERQPAFWVPVGDLVDLGQEPENWRHFLADGEALFRVSPIVPVVGNHDLYAVGRGEGKSFVPQYPELFFSLFPLPPPYGEERFQGWFDLRYGDARLVVLNAYPFPPLGQDPSVSPHTYETEQRMQQIGWARASLADATSVWTFLALHPPIYSSGPHGATAGQGYGRAVANLAEEFGIAAVFSGHTHAFEVGKPLRAGVVDAAGTVYYNSAGINYSAVAAGAEFTIVRQEQEREPRVALVHIGEDGAHIETWNWQTNQRVHDLPLPRKPMVDIPPKPKREITK